MHKSRLSLAIIMMCSMSILSIQCNNPKPDTVVKKDSAPIMSRIPREFTGGIASSPGVNSALPNLFADAAKFLNANGNLVFRFYIDDANDLTVHGWEQPFNNSAPVILMETSTLSAVDLGNKEYLGNLYISASVMADLKQLIRNGNYTTVIFQPTIDMRPGSVGQLIYKIKLSTTLPRLRSTISKDSAAILVDTSGTTFAAAAGGTTADTGILLNPSPPRNE